MSSKKSRKFVFAIAATSLLTVGAISIGAQSSLELPFSSVGSRNSLTGLEGNDGQVVVVKLDDTTFAHPQVGLRSADVVYIEQVEGGLTRLAAVFSSKIPAVVGPVRSARISDIELLSQYGRVGFSYSGAQKLMRPVIAAANLADIGATHYGPNFYANDPNRIAPYAMMVQLSSLVTEANTSGDNFVQSTSMGWKFGEKPDSQIKIEKVHIPWPASSYDATWSEGEGRWLLIHNGAPDTDDTGYQLGPKTIVIQQVSISNSIYYDKVGGITPFSATVGSGKCFLLRDGGYIPCLWKREAPESGTSFTDLSGKEIFFERGQIWFALTSKEPLFTASSVRDAAKSPNK